MKLVVILICAFLIYELVKNYYEKRWYKNVELELKFSKKCVVEGEKAELIEIISNNKKLPLPFVYIKFNTSKYLLFQDEENLNITDNYYRNDIFSIYSYEKITRKLPFICLKRGCYTISGVDIVSKGIFMNQLLVKSLKNTAMINVYPKKLPMKNFEVIYKKILGEYILKSNIIEDPFAFRGIREYQPYDNIKNINWKVSAKHKKYYVNNFYSTSSQEVVILLNLNIVSLNDMEYLQEKSISIASTLARELLKSNIPVSLKSNARDIFTLENIVVLSGSGANHMLQIDYALSRIDIKKENSSFDELMEMENKKFADNTFFIIISNFREENLQKKIDSCVWIIPEMENEKVEIVNNKTIFKWEISK